MFTLPSLLLATLAHGGPAGAPRDDLWLELKGHDGPGAGKHVVLIAGDEEYRSEEALPMLARILAVRHGFDCTVLFSTNPEDGTIDPTNQTHIPGMEKVADADLLVLFLRFRELPDADMQHFVDALNAGKPIIALRTSTHAFHYSRDRDSPFARFSFNSSEWPGGFGRQILGETWVNHHGHHGAESTRGLVAEACKDRPILRGVTDVWGPTDVYGVRDLPDNATVLLHGQVLAGMTPDSPPVEGDKNEPMMPLVWEREYTAPSGATGWTLCSTLGASVDCQSEGLRRLLVNACYVGCGLDEHVPESANVDPVGAYEPTAFGFGKERKGMRASDFALEDADR